MLPGPSLLPSVSPYSCSLLYILLPWSGLKEGTLVSSVEYVDHPIQHGYHHRASNPQCLHQGSKGRRPTRAPGNDCPGSGVHERTRFRCCCRCHRVRSQVPLCHTARPRSSGPRCRLGPNDPPLAQGPGGQLRDAQYGVPEPRRRS